MKACKLCDAQTNAVVNINFTATPVCDRCTNAIFIQQAVWFSERESARIKTT